MRDVYNVIQFVFQFRWMFFLFYLTFTSQVPPLYRPLSTAQSATYVVFAPRPQRTFLILPGISCGRSLQSCVPRPIFQRSSMSRIGGHTFFPTVEVNGSLQHAVVISCGQVHRVKVVTSIGRDDRKEVGSIGLRHHRWVICCTEIGLVQLQVIRTLDSAKIRNLPIGSPQIGSFRVGRLQVCKCLRTVSSARVSVSPRKYLFTAALLLRDCRGMPAVIVGRRARQRFRAGRKPFPGSIRFSDRDHRFVNATWPLRRQYAAVQRRRWLADNDLEPWGRQIEHVNYRTIATAVAVHRRHAATAIAAIFRHLDVLRTLAIGFYIGIYILYIVMQVFRSNAYLSEVSSVIFKFPFHYFH